MEINDLELILAQIEHTESETPVRTVLVRVTSESGLEGWGEAAIAWQPGELAGRRDALLAVLEGRSFFDIEELLALPTLENADVRSAVEMACWDLIGKATGQPLCHLLGGSYRERVSLAVRVPGATLDDVAANARELAEQGFHSQIISTSGKIEHDTAVLTSVHESIGERAELRFDAAGQFDLETARELCSELEDHALQFVLDPVDDLASVGALASQTSVPLAVGRSVHNPADVLAALRSRSTKFAIAALGRVGGIVAARNCAAVAEAGGLAITLDAGPSLGIATAAMLQLAGATPALSGCNECAYHQLRDDILIEPLETLDGRMAVPRGSGLGIHVDRAKVERCQVM